jgi:hypothetical protein
MHQGEEPAAGSGAQRDEFERMIDELHVTVRSIASGLPAVYGLARFPTPHCTVGGWAATDDRAERIALLYGDFGGTGPLAVIHTTQGSAEFLAGGLHYGEGTLDPAFALSPEDELPILRRFEHFESVPDLALPLAGRRVVLHCRQSGAAWYAWTESSAGGLGVVVEAAGIGPSDIRLAVVNDLTPYLDGHRTLLRNASWAG